MGHQKEMGICKLNAKFGERELTHWLKLMQTLLDVIVSNMKQKTTTGILETVKKWEWYPSKALGIEVLVVTQELWRKLDRFRGGCSTVSY